MRLSTIHEPTPAFHMSAEGEFSNGMGVFAKASSTVSTGCPKLGSIAQYAPYATHSRKPTMAQLHRNSPDA